MATTLLVSTCNMNEAICKLFYPTCVSWNTQTDQWKYSPKPSKRFLLHLLTIGLLSLNFWTSLGLAVYCMLFNLDWFSIGKLLIVSALLSVALFWVFLEDGFLVFFGSEMVSVANWATVCIRRLKIYPPPKPRSNLFLEYTLEVNKAMQSNPNIDKFGMVASYALIKLVSLVVVVPFVFVFSDMDLCYFFIFLSSKAFGFIPLWSSSWYVRIIRYFLFLYTFQSVTVAMPTFTVVIEAAMQGVVCTLKYLENMDLTYPNTTLFKTIVVCRCFLFNMIKWFTCVFLS